MTDLYIIAAGKGSRMGGGVPKALIPIEEGIPNITTTLKQAYGLFDNIFVVINKDARAAWDRYYSDNLDVFPELFGNENENLTRLVNFVEISSGLGDGHAILSALDSVRHEFGTSCVGDKMVVVWGDAFIQYRETFSELLGVASSSAHENCSFVPAVLKQEPYVCLLTDEKMACMSADFSKYGEKHPSGMHDQSVFYFDRFNLHTALKNLHRCFWKNGRYITPGGELSLLHVFHYLYNIGSPAKVYYTDYPTMGFNTPSEVAEIQREIRKTW